MFKRYFNIFLLVVVGLVISVNGVSQNNSDSGYSDLHDGFNAIVADIYDLCPTHTPLSSCFNINDCINFNSIKVLPGELVQSSFPTNITQLFLSRLYFLFHFNALISNLLCINYDSIVKFFYWTKNHFTS
jgi:hypothetical protein